MELPYIRVNLSSRRYIRFYASRKQEIIANFLCETSFFFKKLYCVFVFFLSKILFLQVECVAVIVNYSG